MSSSATCPQMIMPWETALLDELEDKLGDSVAVKMAKFDKRQHCQCLALQRELEAEEWRKAEEAKRICKEQEAEAKRVRELEAKCKWLEEEMRQAQQAGGSLSQQVLALTGKAINRPQWVHKSCIQCQKLKAKCDLITQTMDMEKRPVQTMSPQGDVDDGDNEVMEDTLDVRTVSCPRVLRTLLPQKDSVAKVLDRRLREVMKLLQKNNTTIKTLARDVWDLSGVLEESFEALKTVMTALVSWAQNANDV
ncbi:hypothetical protein PISMIDRAFT_18253 [Pisolithus microcarpus 441]|uniref:Unplaced genomic scaffold scaffold_339, whole genome shotgun sequence n=1 Tax=Pisolithus microcarpus 441 TaxID=765257 RepID=A0A0C9YGM9_9AGAM|nr:hypothetical protein PISMIDRAFT_18253 [Pisolithus microcarpus 441]